MWNGNVCIRVQRCHRPNRPLPCRTEIKPPDPACFFESEVRHGMLPILWFACHEILIVHTRLTPQHTGSSPRQNPADTPTAIERLYFRETKDLVSIYISPQPDSLTLCMTTAQCISKKWAVYAPLSGRLVLYRRTLCHYLSWKLETCVENESSGR